MVSDFCKFYILIFVRDNFQRIAGTNNIVNAKAAPWLIVNTSTNTINTKANTPINNIKYPTNDSFSIMKNSPSFSTLCIL